MDACDVLIAGGGPAGSTCARLLRRAGVDAVIIDKASFPRDKVCAGWITPQVLDLLDIDADDYRQGRTCQPITSFRVGVIGASDSVDILYDRPVSFGIRRCEFDEYLLRRSDARLRLGTPVTSIRRSGSDWIVNDAIRAPMLVGAGGHFCPVSRLLNDFTDRSTMVAAQEVEFRLDTQRADDFPSAAGRPELYFCDDLQGYGWCFRKQEHLNIGFGRFDARNLPSAVAAFLDFLKCRHAIPADASWPWKGHAYLVASPAGRQVVGDGILLAGDSAGLAYPQSGEGIRPAVESGLMAASVILEANGRYTRDRLQGYTARLRRRFGIRPPSRLIGLLPPRLVSAAARRLLRSGSFVRHVVLDRWFLHTRDREPLDAEYGAAASGL